MALLALVILGYYDNTSGFRATGTIRQCRRVIDLYEALRPFVILDCVPTTLDACPKSRKVSLTSYRT